MMDLKPTEFSVLSEFYRQREGASYRSVAAALKKSKSLVAKTARILQAKGYITIRFTHAYCVHLTEKACDYDYYLKPSL